FRPQSPDCIKVIENNPGDDHPTQELPCAAVIPVKGHEISADRDLKPLLPQKGPHELRHRRLGIPDKQGTLGQIPGWIGKELALVGNYLLKRSRGDRHWQCLAKIKRTHFMGCSSTRWICAMSRSAKRPLRKRSATLRSP